MYLTEIKTKTSTGKISHRCYLLRESYYEKGKVKNRTIANLTHCSPVERDAIRLALKHKCNLSELGTLKDSVDLEQGKSIGAVWLVYEVARRLGIEKTLGSDRMGKLALWQVIARVIDQGSRLSAVRLAQENAACDILGIREGFNENHLYKNLSWLSDNQKKLEKRLFKKQTKHKKPELFLYDVTSSYFEGTNNKLSDWGYNRDKKKGTKQVVIGLLCDETGDPVSIEVFKGNTSDFTTFGSQIKKAGEEFACERVTFVGDRGMIKSKQISELKKAEFNYITAISKPQIEAFLRKDVFQLDLFDEDICEIEHEKSRYILRRNPLRTKEIEWARKEKKASAETLLLKKNQYLAEHQRARVSTALKEVRKKIECLNISDWLIVESDGRSLKVEVNTEALNEVSRLDGCYVITSDLPKDVDAKTIHDRYKSLSNVEHAFRTCKTAMLELRPWFVQSEQSTRGHAFVVMLAYKIVRYLENVWKDFNYSVPESIKLLSTLCSIEMKIKDQKKVNTIPKPREIISQLLSAANVRLPTVLPLLETNIVSRKIS
jgi:transposase